jgi:TRAP-type C4-dicarboxylate transport system substrate-binding protein
MLHIVSSLRQRNETVKVLGCVISGGSGGMSCACLAGAACRKSLQQIEGVQFGAIQAAVIPPEFFVGVDERFEVMAAPGLVTSLQHGQRVAADPAVLKLMLGLGANKGLHGRNVHRATGFACLKGGNPQLGGF